MSKVKTILKASAKTIVIIICFGIVSGFVFGILRIAGISWTGNLAYDIGRGIGIFIGIYLILVFVPSKIFKDNKKSREEV